jgi:hypothetical protein
MDGQDGTNHRGDPITEYIAIGYRANRSRRHFGLWYGWDWCRDKLHPRILGHAPATW